MEKQLSPREMIMFLAHGDKGGSNETDLLPSEQVLDLLRREFSSRDTDGDGKLRLSEVHSLFESLNIVAPNVLHLVMRIVLETSQSWEVTQSQQFSFADTVEIYQLLEKIVRLQIAHQSPRSQTSLPKFPSSRRPLELSFMKRMFQSFGAEISGRISVRKVQVNYKFLFIFMQEALFHTFIENANFESVSLSKEDIFEVIASMDTSKSGFADFVQFEHGFSVLENKIGKFPLFFGNETEITSKSSNTGLSLPSPSQFLYSKEQNQKRSPRTQIPDPREVLKEDFGKDFEEHQFEGNNADKLQSLRGKMRKANIDNDAPRLKVEELSKTEDKGNRQNQFSAFPKNSTSIGVRSNSPGSKINSGAQSPTGFPLQSTIPPLKLNPPSAQISPFTNTGAFTYEPVPELFIEEKSRIVQGNSSSEPPEYYLRSRWRLVPQKDNQTPTEEKPPVQNSNAYNENSFSEKLAFERQITEEIIKLKNKLLEQRKKLADAHLINQQRAQERAVLEEEIKIYKAKLKSLEASNQHVIEELKRRHQIELESEHAKWRNHPQSRDGDLKYKLDSENLQRKNIKQLEEEKEFLERSLQELRTKVAQMEKTKYQEVEQLELKILKMQEEKRKMMEELQKIDTGSDDSVQKLQKELKESKDSALHYQKEKLALQVKLDEKSDLLEQAQQQIHSLKSDHFQMENILKNKESVLKSTSDIPVGQLTERIRELENQLARLELEKQHMKDRFEIERNNLKSELDQKLEENQKEKDNDIQSISQLYGQQIQLLKKRIEDLEKEKQSLEENIIRLKVAASMNEKSDKEKQDLEVKIFDLEAQLQLAHQREVESMKKYTSEIEDAKTKFSEEINKLQSDLNERDLQVSKLQLELATGGFSAKEKQEMEKEAREREEKLIEKQRIEIEGIKQEYEKQQQEWDSKLKQVQENHEQEKEELNTQKQQIRENFDKLEESLKRKFESDFQKKMQSLKEQNGSVIESISKQLQDLTANLKKQISEKNSLQTANTQLKAQVEDLARRLEERPSDPRRSPANNEETSRLRQQFQAFKEEMDKKVEDLLQEKADLENSKKQLEEAVLTLGSQLENEQSDSLKEKITELENALISLADENKQLKSRLQPSGIKPPSNLGQVQKLKDLLNQEKKARTSLEEKNKQLEKELKGLIESQQDSDNDENGKLIEENTFDDNFEDENGSNGHDDPFMMDKKNVQIGERYSLTSSPSLSPAMQALSVVFPGDEVSERLCEIVRKNPQIERYLPQNTARIEKGVYQFGNKQIRMKVVNRDVLVKVGGGFVKFEDYVRHSSNSRTSSLHSEQLNELKEEIRKENPMSIHSIAINSDLQNT